MGLPIPKLQAVPPTSGSTERTQACQQVPPSEGNEVRREGRWEVGVFRSTGEAGEPASRGPGGGKGRPSWGTVGGKHGGDIEPRNRVNATTTDSGTGEASSADGIHFLDAPHRPSLVGGGVPAHASGWGRGRGRTNGADYEVDLRGNLQWLLDRAKSGTYRAPPVRRVHIPKGTGRETRPIGIPTFEDKVLQRAVVMVLESIYEQDFHDCSYGFRPGRSAHQALEALWQQTMQMGGGWVLEVDIRKFFDTLDHAHLREFLQRRVRDGVLLRLIGKWLNAGVLEGDGQTYPDQGTPQGGVISPLLANVYLHYVLDEWFEQDVKPRLAGQVFLIRYADDFVIGFATRRTPGGLWRCCRNVSEVWPDASSRQNAAGAVHAAQPATGRRKPRGRAGYIRPAGVHPLLGPVAAWRLVIATDFGEPVQPGGQDDR